MPSSARTTELIVWGSLSLLWAGVIYFFSSIPTLDPVSNPPVWYILERKSAHVFEFALLTFFLFRFFNSLFVREKRRPALIVALALSLLYALSDEYHQLFVPGRGAKLTDVGIDSIGIILTTIALTLWHRFRR
jgi:VanZ family protein